MISARTDADVNAISRHFFTSTNKIRQNFVLKIFLVLQRNYFDEIEEHIEEEPATFFFDPAFGRRSLMLDISHGSSEYGTESDSGESGMMFAPMNDEEEGSELEMEEMGTDS